MKRYLGWLVFLVLTAVCLVGLVPARALDKQTRLDTMSAVVQMSLVRVEGKQVYYLPWGSGTLVSPDGLILTNCHVADPLRFGLPSEQVPDYDYLGVSLTIKSDRPPQLTYLGEVVQADPYLDLAVVRITLKPDLRPVAAEDLDLPFVELGDSDAVEVGDDLNVFGYPGIGGETVTFTRGVVSGFTLDAAIDGRAWIKTDASISGGNSGGTGVDEAGLLIGVPTRAGVGGGTDPVDCRPVKDTNGDGRIDGSDDCVPIGGFINALRPVNLAKALIEAARRGLPDQGRSTAEPGKPSAGEPAFSGLFFASGVNEYNQPTRIVTSLPSGARSLYLFFDYEGMDFSRVLEMKVLIDGVERPDWSLPAGPWGGGERGLWWIGWTDAAFLDGTYELLLFVDAQEMGRAQLEAGGAPQASPAFANILFSLEATADGEPVEEAVVFPSGAQELLAFFEYENMKPGLRWTHSWRLDGQEIARADEAWRGSGSGRTALTLTNPQGFSPGAYRLSLYLNGELAALSSFWLSEAEESGPAFEEVVFASAANARGGPEGVAESFESGLEELHAFSGFEGMADGLSAVVRWYLDDAMVLEWPFEWDQGESGRWHDYIYSDSGSLPDGYYAVELEVEGQAVLYGSAQVGTGVGPEPTPGTGEGVQVQGTILDMDTQRPIPGALFLVLEPGITLSTFQWTDEELYAVAEADRNGFYELPVLLERGECYSMIVGADGYWPYGEDDVCFAEGDPALLELPVLLERK